MLQEGRRLIGGQGVQQDPQDAGQQPLGMIGVRDNLKMKQSVVDKLLKPMIELAFQSRQ